MPGRAHSRATRLSAAFLARQSGVEAAVAAFGIDHRTVRRWLDAGDVPEDEWTAIRDVLRARAAEMSARGDTKGLVAVLTGAGIADRNVRYSTLIARREARREAEQVIPEPEPLPDPVREAIEALPDDRQQLARDLALLRVLRMDPFPDPEPDGSDESRLAAVAELAALTPEGIAAESELVRAKIAEAHALNLQEAWPARRPPFEPGAEGRVRAALLPLAASEPAAEPADTPKTAGKTLSILDEPPVAPRRLRLVERWDPIGGGDG